MKVYQICALAIAAVAAFVVLFCGATLLVDDAEHQMWWNAAGWSTWSHYRFRSALGKDMDDLVQYAPVCLGSKSRSSVVRPLRRAAPVSACYVPVGDCRISSDCPVYHRQYLLCSAFDTAWLANALHTNGIGCVPINWPR